MTTEIKDPVCGMTVKPDSPHRLEHRGVEYHFCSAKCLAKFQATPQAYRLCNPFSVNSRGGVHDIGVTS